MADSYYQVNISLFNFYFELRKKNETKSLKFAQAKKNVCVWYGIASHISFIRTRTLIHPVQLVDFNLHVKCIRAVFLVQHTIYTHHYDDAIIIFFFNDHGCACVCVFRFILHLSVRYLDTQSCASICEKLNQRWDSGM